jgi:uncharacterized protein (TIGR00297 family)
VQLVVASSLLLPHRFVGDNTKEGRAKRKKHLAISQQWRFHSHLFTIFGIKMLPHYIIYVLLLAGAALSIVARKLTIPGALFGFVTGILVFTGGGYTGIIMLALFFILGSAVTGWQLKQKQQLGFAEENKGRRTAGQVFANGGVAAILGVIVWCRPEWTHVLQLMMAGSLAAAIADTLSSEIGTVLGRRFYNIVTLKKDERGLDGVISLEGTLAGIGGAAVIGMVYATGHSWNIEVLWIILAGTAGTLIDSLLGAVLERKHLIGNNTVNFLNTATGAAVCWLILIT